MGKQEQVGKHTSDNEKEKSSSEYDECDVIGEYSKCKDGMSGESSCHQNYYRLVLTKNGGVDDGKEAALKADQHCSTEEDKNETYSVENSRSVQSTTSVGVKYHTIKVHATNSLTKTEDNASEGSGHEIESNVIAFDENTDKGSLPDSPLSENELLSNADNGNAVDIRSVLEEEGKLEDREIGNEPCADREEPFKMPVGCELVGRREVLSDIDDVSTDSEFLKVNVIDARHLPHTIPSKDKTEKVEQKYSKSKRSVVKMKVNRHTIENTCTLAPIKGNEENPVNGMAVVIQREETRDNVITREPEMIAPSSEQETEIALPTNEIVKVNANREEDVEAGYAGNFTSADAMELLTEMKRHISRGDQESRPRPINRFVIGGKLPMININDIIEIDDFRRRDLYDQVKRRTTGGSFKQCWVRVTNGTMICYKSKAIKDPLLVNGPTNNIFHDPVKGGVSYERKFTIDLSTSELFLGHEQQSCWSWWICCGGVPLNREQLTNVSDLKIRRIRPNKKEYILEVSQGGEISTLVLSNLDFVLRHNDEYYYFRASSIDAFLKWILTYHLRHERGIRSIENMIAGPSE